MGESATVGLLYPGEMGAAFARLLLARGARVVTTLQGRSPKTAARARDAELIVLDSLADVALESDVVIALTSPEAAMDVADAYCVEARRSPPNAIYMDANSIGPEQANAIAAKVAQAGRDFVDGAINGLAKNIAAGGTLFLSGSRAAEIAALLGDAMKVRLLGREPGRASTMKMLLGGLSKGLCALFTELGALAERREMLDEMLDATAEIYPGMMSVVERMLPTYAHHAQRRAVEMDQLKQTIRHSQLEPCLVEAISRLHDRLASLPLDAADGASASAKAFIGRTVAAEVFAAAPSKIVNASVA